MGLEARMREMQLVAAVLLCALLQQGGAGPVPLGRCGARACVCLCVRGAVGCGCVRACANA